MLPEDHQERTSTIIVFLPLLFAVLAGAAFFVWKLQPHSVPSHHNEEPSPVSMETLPASPASDIKVESPEALDSTPTPVGYSADPENDDGNAGRPVIVVYYDPEKGMQFAQSQVVLPVDPVAAAMHLVSVLKAQQRIPEEIQIRQMFKLHERLLLIDLQISAQSWCTGGIVQESAIIATLVSTITTNIKLIKAIRFVINGEERDTLCGHIGLKTSFTQEQALAMMEKLPHN